MAANQAEIEEDILQSDVALKDMTLEDLCEFSSIFASQFNKSDMHDRILCFEIICEDFTLDSGFCPARDESPSKNQSPCQPMCSPDTKLYETKIDSKTELKQDVKATDEGKVTNTKNEMTNIGGMRLEKETEQRELDDDYTERINRIDEESKNGEVENEAAENTSKVVKLGVHSQWLAAQSPYFKALFYSGMKESHTKEVVMKILWHEREAHLTLIEAMYDLDALNLKDYQLIVEVLVLAHKYMVHLVFKKCKYALMSATLTIFKCEYILQRTEHLIDTADLYNVLQTFLVKEFSPIDKSWNVGKFSALSERSLRLLLGSDSLATQSENTIFVALMKWIQTNIPFFLQDKLKKCSLLDVVRFEFMSVDFLYDIVQHHHVAKLMPGFNKYLMRGLAYQGFSKIRRKQLKGKPKKRPFLKEDGPTFSWLIDEELEKKLSNFLEAEFFSDNFWFQGYEMKLNLTYLKDLSKCSFYLYVNNLPKEGCLYVKCTAKSDLFLQPAKIDGLYTTQNNAWGYCVFEKNTTKNLKSYSVDVWVKLT